MAFTEIDSTPSTVEFPQFEFLKRELIKAYEEGVSLEDAERNAARCLDVQITLSEMIKGRALDARMRKNAYKSIRASEYLRIIQTSEKKPTEAQIDAMLMVFGAVCKAQDAYETADIEVEALERYYDIFRDAHIFYRGVARGNLGV